YDNRQSFEIEADLDDVACRARLIGNDRSFPTGEGVEQARLTNIRRAREHHVEPLAQDFTAPTVRKMATNGRLEVAHDPNSFGECSRSDVTLVGEVDRRLHKRKRFHQRVSPPVV